MGTPESTLFFESAMQLARRSLGLNYGVMEYGAEFTGICKVLCSYQYVKQKAEITDAIIEWIYEHSAGVLSIVVSLIHDAQEIAILSGKEILNMETLNEAYQKRLSLLHLSLIHIYRMFQITKSYLHHEMERGAKIAGVKRIRIHDIRHSHVSMLIGMGFSAVDIAGRMGHELSLIHICKNG